MNTKKVVAHFIVSVSLLCGFTVQSLRAEGNSKHVLIFTDLTPGALLQARTAYHVTLANCDTPNLVTTAAELEQQLNQCVWDDIVISIHWSFDEPTFLDKLRCYASDHGATLIQLHAWHDNDRSVPADEAVFATTATAYWQFNSTNLGYSLFKTDNREDPQVEPGLLWPSFDQITPMDPVVESYVVSALAYALDQDLAPPATTQPSETIPDPPCVAIAMGNYFVDYAKCLLNRGEMEGNCNTLHGQNAQAPNAPNPEKYAKCMTDATDTFKKCSESALSLYNSRVSVCPKVPKPTIQPAE
ncbi:MAG: hypothetical protein KF841_10770 [Phycisphaerae bacterium]|nr:hypothetical protein [Phycisphaerae bacterium]